MVSLIVARNRSYVCSFSVTEKDYERCERNLNNELPYVKN